MKTEVNNSQIPHRFSNQFGHKLERIELYISISLFSEIEDKLFKLEPLFINGVAQKECMNLKLIQLFLPRSHTTFV